MPISQISDHTFIEHLLSRESVVLDLGANHGAFSHSMIAKYGCRCIAVEANPFVCATIPPEPRLTVVNAAVASANGTLPIYIGKNDEASSLLRPVNTDAIEEVHVPSLSLVDLLARHEIPRIDLLKVDIEGAEVEVFNSCPDELLQNILQITVEFHDFNDVIPKVEADQIARRL